MTPAPARRVRALSIHVGYRCRHAGACCTSGWDIPVEPEVEERLQAAMRSDRCFRRVVGLPQGARVVLRTDDAGRCVFLDPRRRPSGLCTIHRDLGEDALPSACRHFPRVVTLTPLGVSVTLSHYCPTVAGILLRPVIPRDSGLPGPERSAGPGALRNGFRSPRDPAGRGSRGSTWQVVANTVPHRATALAAQGVPHGPRAAAEGPTAAW